MSATVETASLPSPRGRLAMTAEKTIVPLGWRVYGLGVMALSIVCIAWGDFDLGQPVPKTFPAALASPMPPLRSCSSRARLSSGAGPWRGAPRRSPSTTR